MFPSPSIVPPELADFEYYFNGLRFGAETPFAVLGVEGLDLADIRTGNVNWARDHGQAKGLDLYGGKVIVFDLWMQASGGSLQASQLALAAATVVRTNEEIPLWIKLPTLDPLCIMCRPLKRKMKIDSDYAAANIGKPELSLETTDPRVYGAGVATTISPNHPASTKVLDNTGNTEMRPIIVISGPVARPAITNKSIAGEPTIELAGVAREESEEAAEKKREEEAAPHEAEAAVLQAAGEKLRKEGKIVEARVKEKEAAEKQWVADEILFGKTFREARELDFAAVVLREEAGESMEPTTKEKIEAAEKKEAEAKAKDELSTKERKEALEAREKEEAEGAFPTVEAGDELLIDLGTPHLLQYYVGGVEGGEEPVNVSDWLTEASVWWDLLPGNNTIQFSSFNSAATASKAVVNWAPANEL